MGYETFVIYWMKEFLGLLSDFLEYFFFLHNLYGIKSGNNIKFSSPEQLSTQLLKRVSSTLNFSCAIFPLPFAYLIFSEKSIDIYNKKKHVYIEKLSPLSRDLHKAEIVFNLLLRPTVKKWASSSWVRKFKLKRRINISFHITCGHVGCQERMKYESDD